MISKPRESKLNIQFKDSSFANRIQDAIAKTEITSDFTIVHSDYEPLTVSARYRDYLQQSSSENRDRYLASRLQQYLYAIFNGELKPRQSAQETRHHPSTTNSNLQNEIVNSANSWYKTKFFDRLTQCNHGRGYQDAGWLLIVKETKSWQVSKDGLTIFIDPQKHLFDPDLDLELQIGQKVSILMPPNLVERGLYIAVGDAGSTHNLQPSSECAIAQVYFNVGFKTALVLLDNLTRQLNELKIPFNFKIPYSKIDFNRLDAPVLEFMRDDWQKVEEVVKAIYAQNKAEFYPQVPFFCKQLRPGLGWAEKPYWKLDINLENFGFKYCQFIAESILKTNKQSNLSNVNKLDLTMLYLSEMKINWERFYLN